MGFIKWPTQYVYYGGLGQSNFKREVDVEIVLSYPGSYSYATVR